jgi:hypothetical protein
MVDSGWERLHLMVLFGEHACLFNWEEQIGEMCYLGYGKDDGVSSIIDIRLNQGYAFQIMGYYGSFFIQIKKKMRLWFC